MIEVKNQHQITKLRGIIFDWSGVVMDEIEATGYAHVAVIKKLTGRDVSYEEWRTQIGANWQDFYLQQGVGTLQLSEVLIQFQLEYQKFRSFVRPRSGILVVLSAVKRANYVMAVLSNQTRSVILQAALRYDLLKYFDLIVAADDLEKAKPHPEALFQTLEVLKLKPEEVVLVEDMKDGVQMGIDVGVFTIGIRSELEQDLSMADWHLENVIDLLDILGLSSDSGAATRVHEHSDSKMSEESLEW